MAMHRFRRRARRALVVLLTAIVAVGIAALAATSEEPSKPGPTIRPEGSFAPPTQASNEARVTASAPVPNGVACPGGWSYFDNPVMHYGMCIPPGWGFSDFRDSDPLETVPTVMLENLHLLGNAFPWRPGTMPFDAVRRGATDIELDVLQTGAASTDECRPSTQQQLGALSVLSCEQLYGDDGMPAGKGSLRALKVIVPLRTGPVDEPDARLLVIARTRTAASLAEVTTLWQIVQHVHAY